MPGERFKFTNEALDRARELKAQGLTWDEVAEYLGCKTRTLKVTISNRKSGRNKGLVSIWEKRREEVEKAAMAGKSPPEIAENLKITKQQVWTLFTNLGIDKQERKEFREQQTG